MVLIGAGAGGGAVLLGARPTGVILLWAARGQVVPTMAFEAAQGLLIAFFSVYFFLAYEKTISQSFIS